MKRYIIIGNGPAGVNAIEAIRKVDKDGKIINVCAEPYLPYSRPLLPYLISGKIKEDNVYFRPKSFYKDYKVTPILGNKVEIIEPENKIIHLSDGKKIGYDKLLIASGMMPRELNIKGLDTKNVFYVTKLDFVKKIISQLSQTKLAVILGGGPQGLEVALALSHRKIKTKVIIGSQQVLSQVLHKDAATVIQKRLEDSGIEFVFGNEVVEITGKENVGGVVLKTGERIKCEMVIVGKGLRPNLDFLAKTKSVRVDMGIVVDKWLKSSVENIYAAGDVAETYDILSGSTSIVGVWPRASEQGYYAGANMADFPKEYAGAYRMNTFNFEGLSCIVIGDTRIGDARMESEQYEAIVRMNLKRQIYQRIILEDDVVKGIEVIGRIVNVGAINRFIRRKVNVERFKSNLLAERATFVY